MFVNVITNKEVPPAVMVDGVNVLPTTGRLGATVSPSATVQVPDVHTGFVFETPVGTEIVAVLVTCVCAHAFVWHINKKNVANRMRMNIPGV